MQTYHVARVRAVVAPRIGVAAHVRGLFVQAQEGRAVGVAAAAGALGEVAVAYRCRRRQGGWAAARVRGKSEHERNGERSLSMRTLMRLMNMFICLENRRLILRSRGCDASECLKRSRLSSQKDSPINQKIHSPRPRGPSWHSLAPTARALASRLLLHPSLGLLLRRCRR